MKEESAKTEIGGSEDRDSPAPLLAGTKVRGEFEERMEAVVREASMEPKPLLFIDEIHLILGAGQGAGFFNTR